MNTGGQSGFTLFQSTLSVRRATIKYDASVKQAKFQSTLSVRRATGRVRQSDRQGVISIHALRKESDSARTGRMAGSSKTNFNPRSP